MNNCIFCKIIKGKIPSDKLQEDDKTFTFLDANPASLGHTLVIPKKHCETLDEMNKEDLIALILQVKKVSKIIIKLNPGYNIIQNNKPIGGQIVPHVHFHIIPRKKGDDMEFKRNEPKFSKKETESIQNKIKTLLK